MLKFTQYSGCGNDFILIDHRIPFIDDPSALAKKICDRNSGIGADGLILLETSDVADAKMSIYNSDGSEAAMCGNGLRSTFVFMQELGIAKKQAFIETLAGIKQLKFIEGNLEKCLISAELGAPTKLKWDLPLSQFASDFEGKGTLHFLDTGVPHAVFLSNTAPSEDALFKLSQTLRHHPDFGQGGANVNLVWQNDDLTLSIRTFERGVEGETLACGTGATAAALAASRMLQLPSPISLKTRSKETLTLSFSLENGELSSPILTGAVTRLSSGHYPDLAHF